jgi:hypothetical protein
MEFESQATEYPEGYKRGQNREPDEVVVVLAEDDKPMVFGNGFSKVTVLDYRDPESYFTDQWLEEGIESDEPNPDSSRRWSVLVGVIRPISDQAFERHRELFASPSRRRTASWSSRRGR